MKLYGYLDFFRYYLDPLVYGEWIVVSKRIAVPEPVRPMPLCGHGELYQEVDVRPRGVLGVHAHYLHSFLAREIHRLAHLPYDIVFGIFALEFSVYHLVGCGYGEIQILHLGHLGRLLDILSYRP